VKYFRIEEGTDKVTTLIHDLDNELRVLELARVEFFSAIFKNTGLTLLTTNNWIWQSRVLSFKLC
jgi:hypothetical protein